MKSSELNVVKETAKIVKKQFSKSNKLKIEKIYWFKPNFHWNVISEEVYNCLTKFYDQSYFKITEEK